MYWLKHLIEIKDSITFCSNKINFFSIKLDSLAAKVNDNGKKLFEAENKM